MSEIIERLLEIASKFIEENRYLDDGHYCRDCGQDPEQHPHESDCLVTEWDGLFAKYKSSDKKELLEKQ